MNFIFNTSDGILSLHPPADPEGHRRAIFDFQFAVMLQKRIPQSRIDDQPSISAEMMREAEGILHQHLKRVGLKQTGQRDTILRTFLETRDHLSTDELHRLVQKKDAGIGYTTVYRTLKLLTECGLASEVAFHDGIARYEHQYNRRSHHHMVCTECGSSVEFFAREVDQIEQEIGRRHHYLTTRHTFQIYGICENCRRQDGRTEKSAKELDRRKSPAARMA